MNKYLIDAQKLVLEGRYADAAELCKKIIKRGIDVGSAKKMLAECFYNLGVMHTLYSGMWNEAEANYRSAVENDPGHINAINNLGSILSRNDRPDEAISLFQKGLKVSPMNLRLLENLAKAQQQADKLSDASQTLLKLAGMRNADSGAYLVREALLVHKIVPDINYPAETRTSIFEKLAAIEKAGAKIASPMRFPATYFPLSYHGLANRDLVTYIAQIYLQASPSLGWVAPETKNWKGPQGKIKIGFASHFFYAHSIGNTSRGLIQQLDRNIFEVVLIRLGQVKKDMVSDEMDRTADRVVLVSGDDLSDAREAIAKLSLDILFYQDIGMEPISYFLAFARLAPVQLTSFGHPDTTGIPNMDYFVSSENYETGDAQQHYSERLITLPNAGTLAFYHRPPQSGKAPARESFNLGATDRIYLCPQSLFKIHPEMDEIFLGILEKDESAKIVLIEMAQKELRTALEKRMKTTLQGLMNRVRFVKSLPYDKFLDLIQCADVMLDTLHFNGQNTSLEAFSLGTPVITMPGQLQRERHTYGMYLAMNFMDLIATTKPEYVEKAVRIATDSEFRNYCKNRIADSCAVLFEDADFVRNCEKMFLQMVKERMSSRPS